jgi:hypothetical protein
MFYEFSSTHEASMQTEFDAIEIHVYKICVPLRPVYEKEDRAENAYKKSKYKMSRFWAIWG